MYLLCDHHSFESNVCQFIWTITMFEIFSITILCDKHAKIVFLYVSSFVQLLLELGFLRQFSTRNILKSCFLIHIEKKYNTFLHYIFALYPKKSLSLCINHIHARCYIKCALAHYHCFRVVTACYSIPIIPHTLL